MVSSFLGTGARARESLSLAGADSLWATGHHDKSLSILQLVAKQAVASHDTTGEVAALTRLGARQIAMGQPGKAGGKLGRAVELAATQRDTAALLPALRWLSLTAGQQGQTATADSLYRQLYDIATAAGDQRHQGWACVGFASRALETGQPTEAAQWYQQAADRLQQAGEVGGELWARNGQGIALNRQRRYREALAVYTEVAERARKAGAAMTLANATNNIGNLQMLLGYPAAAQQAFGQALVIADSLGLVESQLTTNLNLALCETELGNYELATAVLDSNLALCRTHNLVHSRGRMLLEKARLEAAGGRHHAARRLQQAVLAMGDSVAADDRARAVLELARDNLRATSPATALAVLDTWLPRLPLDGLGVVKWELALLQARALLAADRASEATKLLAGLDPEINTSGVMRLILEYRLLRGRAMAATDHPTAAAAQLYSAVQMWEKQREKPGEMRWREARAAQGRDVFLTLARLLAEHPDLATDTTGEVFRVLQRYKARTLLERTAGPAFADSLQQRMGSPAALETFQAHLKPGDLVLDWYTGPRYSLLMAVTPTATRLTWLPGEDELSAQVDAYLELLSTETGLAVASRALSEKLFGALSDLLAEAQHIVSCPDGPLNRLPLVVVAHYADSDSAVTTPAWTSLPSLAFLTLTARQTPHTGRGLLLLGESVPGQLVGPSLERYDLEHRYRDCESLVLEPDGVPVNAALLDNRRVLHLAGHVLNNNQRPWQAAIELPFSFGNQSRSPLTAERLLTMDLGCDLTVLNGCATAAGRVIPGEGVLGLTTAFLAAGSRSVVATLWPVDDRTAVLFSRNFYAQLAAGQNVETAVARAQKKLRELPETAAPRQWGAYAVYGDGRLVVDLRRRRPWLVIGGGALLVVGLLGQGLWPPRRRPRGGTPSTNSKHPPG